MGPRNLGGRPVQTRSPGSARVAHLRAPAPSGAQAGLPAPSAAEAGFTIIEALVAALILTVGLLAAFMMLATAVHSTAEVRAREGAVTLARQITDDAREIPYSQISSSTLTTTLQGFPGLASTSSPGSSWTIKRGATYTVSVSLTDLNDPKDTSGATDIKQVTAVVEWTTFSGQSHTVSETTTLTRAGQDPGLAASALQLATPAVGSTGVAGTASAPVITGNNTQVPSLSFSVSAPTGTTAIVWTLNGAKQSSWDGSAPAGGTTWSSTAWPLSGLSDGTYTVGAQAEDSNGVAGPGVTMTVRLIRNVPSAPSLTGAGFNANFMSGGSATSAAELQWSPNPELNVVGYLITSPTGSSCQTLTTSTYPASCGSNWWCFSATACADMSPPSYNASNLTYQVQASYYDAANTLQQGTASSVPLASGTPSPPGPPQSVTVSPQSDGTAYITWTPPSGGTAVSFYRIYRDGDNYLDRYDTLSAGSCSSTCSYHDTGRTTAHSYYVTSVGGTTLGSDMAESAATGPATG